MEIRQTNIPIKRRSFFMRVLGALAGGWMIGNLFPGIGRSSTEMKNNNAVHVTINPLAVPRTTKESAPHGDEF